MKKFCVSLREHAIKFINFKKQKVKLLRKSSRNNMKMQKAFIFVKKNLKINPAVFHGGTNYNYHFIKKELAEEFKKQFTCLGEVNRNQMHHIYNSNRKRS